MVGKYERELASAERIFGILEEPMSKEFLDLWKEFEAEETPDAVFACAIDRIMPFLLNTHSSGRSWTEAGITENQARKIIEHAVKRASDELGEVFEILINKALDEEKLRKN